MHVGRTHDTWKSIIVMTPGILITEDQPCPISPGFLDNDNVMNTDNTVSTHLKPTVCNCNKHAVC